MRTKLHKVMLSALLAASVAVMMPTAAHAARGNPGGGGYVPPTEYGQNPDTEPLENPYEPVVPTEVPVDLPGVTDPGAGPAGGGDPLAEAPNVAPTTLDLLEGSNTPPEVEAPSDGAPFGGILSRTGAETMPLARAGLAALTLGVGLVILSRRRRQAATAA